MEQRFKGRLRQAKARLWRSSQHPQPAKSLRACIQVADCVWVFKACWQQLLRRTMHEAEALAWHALNARTGQLWTLARMIISLLPFEDDDRAHGNGLVLHLGLYVKGGIHGFYKHTKHFPNVCRVLNQLLLAVCPGHCWSAITIGANNRTLPHRDKWNHEGDSLLLGVSHQVDGGLWVESAGGSHYDECQEQLLAGVLMDTISTGVLFNGRSCWHATQSWTGGNRVVIVAYVPGHAERVKDAQLSLLRALGFLPPVC